MTGILSKREQALNDLIDRSKCARLQEKFKGIAALPLALPKFELDDVNKFWEIWNANVTTVSRQVTLGDRGSEGAPNPSLERTQWDGLALYEDPTLLGEAAWRTVVSEELADSQKNYVKSIFDLLPFQRIRSIRLWSAHRKITPHYDGNMPPTLDRVLQFPAEIRIMLDDKNPSETFWICSNTKYKPNQQHPIPDNDKLYVKLPTDSNAFAWNNENFLHGADYDPRYKKILVVVKGWVDLDKLETLIDASIDKYPEFILKELNE
jgi:hypothetical protein